MNFLINFLKSFVLKFLTTKALERILIITLKTLVQRSESKVDDEIFEAVFGKIRE